MDAPEQHDGGLAPDERVRFCLRCGAVVAFDQRTCPACGQVEPLPGTAAEVACESCGRSRPAALQFCPGCGQESGDVWPPVPTMEVSEPPSAGGLLAASVALAWLAPLAAILGLALSLRSLPS